MQKTHSRTTGSFRMLDEVRALLYSIGLEAMEATSNLLATELRRSDSYISLHGEM